MVVDELNDPAKAAGMNEVTSPPSADDAAEPVALVTDVVPAATGTEAPAADISPAVESGGGAIDGPMPPAGWRQRGRLLTGGGCRRDVLTVLALAAILVVGAYFRFLGMDWDAGHHLHPDERFLTMVEAALQMPEDFGQYLDTQSSPLNPRNQGHTFFVYGTWPITLVYLIADAMGETDYSHVNLVGRKLMAVFDLLAILLLYGIGTRLYDRRVGLLAAALAAFTAFSIQQSHFFTVDTAANFFVLLFFFAAVGMMRHGRWEDIAFAGLAVGMALASKISVWPLVPLAVLVLILAEQRRQRGLAREWPRLSAEVLLLGVVAFLTLRVTQPDMWVGPRWAEVVADPAQYASLAGPAPSWWRHVESLMPDALEPCFLPDPRFAENLQRVRGLITGHGQDWPPNHQWWHRTAYWFPWKNMVLWGMGIPLGLAAWLGWAAAGVALFRGRRRHLLPWLWVAFVFAYQGGQWVKTMRYFVPIYPLLTLLAAWGLVALYDRARARARPGGAGAIGWRAWLRGPGLALGLVAVVLGGTAVWGFMVSRLYTRDHSRVAGSRWIYHNVPAAVALTVKDGQGPGLYMPVGHPADLIFDGHRYTIAEDDRLGAARVLVPTTEPVTIDGVRLAYLTDPAGDPQPERIRAWLTTDPFRDNDGSLREVLAEGEFTVSLSATDPQAVRIDLPETVLEPDGEYYVWLEFAGAPVAGRLPILGFETVWDDVIPLGMDGYAAYDDPSTPWGEGFYGQENLDLYAEDDPAKAEWLVERLAEVDYIVISSNRVYGAIAQMPTRYPMTLRYYDLLFGEQLGFAHVADLHSYPNLGWIEVNDQSADEAWHVYDHPKVDVFARSESFDPAALRADLEPYTAPDVRTWRTYAEESGADQNPVARLLGRLAGAGGLTRLLDRATGGDDGDVAVAQDRPLEDVMLPEAQRLRQVSSGTWSRLFDADGLLNRQPALAALAWYLVLLLLGVIAFPLTATALVNLDDRGWSVSRIAGLLATSWLAWLVASLTSVAHTPGLVWASAFAVAAVSLAVGGRRLPELGRWLARHWRLVLAEEALFAVLFGLFLAIRMGNPDLWHPYFGGEKPMDLAYLDAVLRTVHFPPYDPWFAGGKMNYYYFGFVFIGALIELTRIVPWLAYNLALPSLAAMTGLGVFGVVFNWSRRLHRPRVLAGGAALVAAGLAVLSGNLYQVPFAARKLAEVAPLGFRSEIPGVQSAVRAALGWVEVVMGRASLAVPTHHWYWNASRAIEVPSDTPITEFPFFTFLYADLHAHMMALPITVLALATALSWALPAWKGAGPAGRPLLTGIVRLLLAALAIGALWPANTWDYPTYGLVAAGAIAAGQWERRGRPGWGWLVAVGLRGGLLLVFSLLFFWPYHRAYVQPYASFDEWWGTRTPLSSYLTVHGIFLFAIVTLVLVRLERLLARDGPAAQVRQLLFGSWAAALAVMSLLWWRAGVKMAGNDPPAIWLPVGAAVLLALGGAWLLWPRLRARERFAAWLFVLGLVLTQFVEYIVLKGDIGRMNTVFKFYIQVWILWSVLASMALAWLAPRLRRAKWGAWWSAAMAAMVFMGLIYTVTAARAKIQDRFPAMGDLAPEARSSSADNWRLGLSGASFLDYAVYDDDGFSLHLKYDWEGIRWMQEHVDGTPTILEGFREKAYRWGSRYSIYTGLPTVIGWDWHQKQQRNAVGGGVVDGRVRDVREMYDTVDIGRALDLLRQYRVQYVIVGEMERAFYSADGLAKFDQLVGQGMAEVVFENPGVRIYQLAGAALAEESEAP